MFKISPLKKKIISSIGVIGTVACIVAFIREPSWPTPDKLLVLLGFVFMIFNQAWDMLKKFIPFIAVLIIYDCFRGLVPYLNSHVHWNLMPRFDEFLFGGELPTVILQHWLVHGTIQWYDFLFYGFYMLHFVLPIGLAAAIYKLRPNRYWQYALTYMTASFGAFFVYLAFPAAPPWMASINGTIPHITRVSSEVFAAFGITSFPSLYNSMAPNPVAAVPSLHCAYSIIFAIFAFKLFGKKWGALSLLYPFFIIVGVVYMGEHYVFDAITGAMLAVGSYQVAPYLLRQLQPRIELLLARATALRPRLVPEEAEESTVV